MGEHGQQETLYHPERRVLRVLGREYPLAGVDETVILLVDEASSGGLDPTVTPAQNSETIRTADSGGPLRVCSGAGRRKRRSQSLA